MSYVHGPMAHAQPLHVQPTMQLHAQWALIVFILMVNVWHGQNAATITKPQETQHAWQWEDSAPKVKQLLVTPQHQCFIHAQIMWLIVQHYQHLIVPLNLPAFIIQQQQYVELRLAQMLPCKLVVLMSIQEAYNHQLYVYGIQQVQLVELHLMFPPWQHPLVTPTHRHHMLGTLQHQNAFNAQPCLVGIWLQVSQLWLHLSWLDFGNKRKMIYTNK